MKKLKEFQFKSGECTLEDYVKYHNKAAKCSDLSKIPDIVYTDRIINGIKLIKRGITVDYIIETLNSEIIADRSKFNYVVIKVIIALKVKELPSYFTEIFESQDTDYKTDLFLKWLRSLNID